MGDVAMVLVFMGSAFFLGVLVGALVTRFLTRQLIRTQDQLIAQLKRELARLSRVNGH